jgi:hypothetical protein
MCGHDEDGPAPGPVETDDLAVRSWAASYFDSVRDDAACLDSGSVPTAHFRNPFSSGLRPSSCRLCAALAQTGRALD